MASFFKNKFGIRFKLLCMSSFLLVIPWLGYQYILEMEQYLSRGQEQTVLGTSRALATALSERPELFNKSNFSRAREGQNLYVYPVVYPLAVDDGDLLDWRDYQQYEQHYRESSAIPNPQNQFSSFRGQNVFGDPLSFRLMLGEYNSSLYIYLRVIDENVILRERGATRIDRSDSLHISILNRDEVFEQYVIAPFDNEVVYPYRIGNDITDVSAYERETRITGRWSRTQAGYDIELRLPLEMLGNKFGLAIHDVDETENRAIAAIVSSSGINSPEELGTLLRPSPELDRIVAGMGLSNSRVQVIDRSQRVLLSVGDIQTATGLMLADEIGVDNNTSGAWAWIERTLLHPLYYQVLSKPITDFVDDLYEGGTLEGEHIIAALNAQAMTRYRTLDDSQTRILEAAHPIVVNNEVLGAVVVDQNMNGIRTFRNQALEILFDTMLGILFLIVAAIFIFATNLSTRLRNLRNQAEDIIDDSGRISNTIVPSRSADEIGDLSRSFSNILDRLSQYTHYLENMSSRLSHELRTPVSIVRSSLENLRMVSVNEEEEVYIKRAEEGITRLNLILTNMSEAARLEQILQDSEKETTDLNKVVEACAQGYSQIYLPIKVEAKLENKPVLIQGNADYIVQLMDKLVANAVEFSYPNKSIILSCSIDSGEAVLSVLNYGPFLAESMKDRIFDSMISVRPEGKNQQPHLGMGLHIARMVAEYHDGYIYADNLLEEEGVIVVVRIPLT